MSTEVKEGAEPELPAADTTPVDLDLDALERDGKRPGPFTFRVEGEQFSLADPQDIDWQDLLVATRNPLMFIRYTLGEDEYKRFLRLKMPEWKMEKLMAAFFKHFGMTDSPEVRALLGS